MLGVREQIVFPGGIGPLVVIGERSARVVEQVMNGSERLVAVVTARVEGEGEPDGADLYPVGTACVVQRMLRAPDGSLRLLVQGLERIRIGEVADEDVLPNAAVEVIPDHEQEGTELDALTRTLETLFGRMIALVPYLPDELQAALGSVESGGTLSYLVASSLRLESDERQDLLEQADVAERLRRVTTLVNRELEVLELGQKIQQDVKADMDSAQREHFLRQQMKAIQDELGEGGSVEADIAEIRGRLEAANPPPAVREAAERELGRLERVPEASPENGVIRSYLEWIVDLPWATTTEDSGDLTAASEILDADHHGLQRIKERILEHLAVVTLNPDAPGPVLCFVGPPGVGKTSLGASIARALGREFARISVGGVRDESEIRGHRRTYVGALPGTIVRALRDAGSMNPVMMIDEIDKMGADVRGDPAAAMLEVLDPAQNDTFRDHYLDLPVDLSRVMFHMHCKHPRHHSRSAARPDGDDQPPRLYRGGQAGDRPRAPARPPAHARRRGRRRSGDLRRGDRGGDLGVHARGGRAAAGAASRRADAEAGSSGRRPESRAPSRLTPTQCAISSATSASTTRPPGVPGSPAWQPASR